MQDQTIRIGAYNNEAGKGVIMISISQPDFMGSKAK